MLCRFVFVRWALFCFLISIFLSGCSKQEKHPQVQQVQHRKAILESWELVAEEKQITNPQKKLIIFPLSHYSQKISIWIKPTASNYNQPLVSAEFQQQRMKQFYRNKFSTDEDSISAWNPHGIQMQLQEDLSLLGANYIAQNNNVGANFEPYSKEWIHQLIENENLQQFKRPLTYNPQQRGIATTNLNARLAATDEPLYYLYIFNGKKVAFGDDFQVSSLWVGTPVYVIGKTKDGLWSLVMTSNYIAWVKSSGIAIVDDAFIRQWQMTAQKKLVAITKTGTMIQDQQNNNQQITYVGTVFPLVNDTPQNFQVLIPLRDNNGDAKIDRAFISKQNAVLMPFTITPHHIAEILATLIGRPYMWGGKNFYNDCSQEMQSLFTPFGFWLPRNSSQQIYMGRYVDLTSDNPKSRVNYLIQHGHPLMTIIYIGGHIILYVGSFPNPHAIHREKMAMTYQDLWRILITDEGSAMFKKSLFFPLLLHYPELPRMTSLAAKRYFIISFLDEMPSEHSKK